MDRTCFYCDHYGIAAEERSEHMIEMRVYVLARNAAFLHVNTENYAEWRAAHRWVSLYQHRWDTRIVCDAHMTECDHCGDYYTIPNEETDFVDGAWQMEYADLTWENQDWMCRACFENTGTCERCERRVDLDELTAPGYDGDYQYCGRCLPAVAWRCREDGYWNWHEEVCYDCGLDSRGRSAGIHDYSYKPEPIFHSRSEQITTARTPFFGIELEIECDGDRGDAAQYLYSKINGRDSDGDDEREIIYLKHDGSLNNGFEIVTHPGTLEFWQGLDYDWVQRLVTDYGCTSWRTDTCGLHVHVSRRAIASKTHLYHFYHLIIDNKEQMVKLAGRDSYRWASFEGVRSKIGKVIKGEQYPARYEAVNLLPEETIELRLFRGSLNQRRILMAIELTHAAITYTRPLTSNDFIKGAVQWPAFATWVRSQSEQYPNLLHYIDLYSF